MFALSSRQPRSCSSRDSLLIPNRIVAKPSFTDWPEANRRRSLRWSLSRYCLKALRYKGPFIAKRVVKTLPCNPHFAHQYVQRGMLVAKTPEDIHCCLQCLPRFKFFCSSNTGLYGLIYPQSIQIDALPATLAFLNANLLHLGVQVVPSVLSVPNQLFPECRTKAERSFNLSPCLYRADSSSFVCSHWQCCTGQ